MLFRSCGVIITTNHKADGIYLPANDRRHFVAWSERTEKDFPVGYFPELYRWLADGGDGHVAAFLRTLDISNFDAKATPRKTAAFWEVVDANRAPEDAEVADALDKINTPSAVTIQLLADNASLGFSEWLQDRRNRRQIPHRLEAAGYTPVRNDAATDGLWKAAGKRQAIYARREMTIRDRIVAAQAITSAGRS